RGLRQHRGRLLRCLLARKPRGLHSGFFGDSISKFASSRKPRCICLGVVLTYDRGGKVLCSARSPCRRSRVALWKPSATETSSAITGFSSGIAFATYYLSHASKNGLRAGRLQLAPMGARPRRPANRQPSHL